MCLCVKNMSELRHPEEPLPSDCCNSGCNPCILDVYKDLLSKWEEDCKSKSSNRSPESVEPSYSDHTILSPTRLSCFKVINITELCQDIIIVRLQAVVKQEEVFNCVRYCNVHNSLDFNPGQYFILQSSPKIEGKDCLISRPYTPVSDKSLNKSGCFEVIVKIYPQGRMSQFWQTLTLGEVTLWRGPYGSFSYERNTFTHILMLCAGTGVSPLYSIADTVVHDELDDTMIKMLFCCRDVNCIILRKALHSLRSFWNFNVDIYLSQECEAHSSTFYGETLKTARITKDIIASELQKLSVENTLVLICGNSMFCNEMNEFVKQDEYKVKLVHIFS